MGTTVTIRSEDMESSMSVEWLVFLSGIQDVTDDPRGYTHEAQVHCAASVQGAFLAAADVRVRWRVDADGHLRMHPWPLAPRSERAALREAGLHMAVRRWVEALVAGETPATRFVEVPDAQSVPSGAVGIPEAVGGSGFEPRIDGPETCGRGMSGSPAESVSGTTYDNKNNTSHKTTKLLRSFFRLNLLLLRPPLLDQTRKPLHDKHLARKSTAQAKSQAPQSRMRHRNAVSRGRRESPLPDHVRMPACVNGPIRNGKAKAQARLQAQPNVGTAVNRQRHRPAPPPIDYLQPDALVLAGLL